MMMGRVMVGGWVEVMMEVMVFESMMGKMGRI